MNDPIEYSHTKNKNLLLFRFLGVSYGGIGLSYSVDGPRSSYLASNTFNIVVNRIRSSGLNFQHCNITSYTHSGQASGLDSKVS